MSGLTVLGLVTLFLGVLLWHQRRLAGAATRWGRQLLEALDSERDRIAGELHDDMVPRVIAARHAMEQGSATDASAILSEITAGLRGLAHDLHPPALRHLDLGQALSDLADDQWEASGPELSVVVEGRLPHIDNNRSLALYRIAQEAIMNATRHANASAVEIHLAASNGEAVLTIRDNGRGVADPSVLGMGFGTRSMRERALGIGGRLEFASRPGEGTTVTCRVPFS